MKVLRLVASVLAATIVAASPMFAPAFIKFDGVDGEAKARGREGWIEVTAGFTDLPSPPTTREAGSGQATGRRTHKPVTFTKAVDKSSPKLAEAHVNGKVFATLVLSQDDKTYTFTRARIANIATAAGQETITLSFEDVTIADNAPTTRVSEDRPKPQVQAAEPARRPPPRPDGQ